VLIPGDAIQFIRETGRVFRETSPRPDFELQGIVIGLQRMDEQQPGRVTVWGVVDGAPRKVILELAGGDYAQAIKAHKSLSPIRCQGHLTKSGNQFELKGPQGFELDE
jgi:hypothetical protein